MQERYDMSKEIITMAMLAVACETAAPPGQPIVPKESLHGFTMRLIEDRAPTLPFYKKELLASNIERTANKIFKEEEARRTFAALVAVESGFNEKAISTAKAVGLTQVLPQYSKGFMKACGIDDFNPADLQLVELNLMAGACAFKQLLELNGGNTVAALVSYNSGMSSTSFKNLLKGLNIANTETASYPSKILYLKEKTELAQDGARKYTPSEDGVRSIRSLEKSAEKRTAKSITTGEGH